MKFSHWRFGKRLAALGMALTFSFLLFPTVEAIDNLSLLSSKVVSLDLGTKVLSQEIKPPFNLKITKTPNNPTYDFYLTWQNNNADQFRVYQQSSYKNESISDWEKVTDATKEKKLFFRNHFIEPTSRVCFYAIGLKNGEESEPSEKVCIDFEDNVIEPEPGNLTCTDTDGGKNYYKKGAVTISDNGEKKTKFDSCWNDGKRLQEYVCNNGEYAGDHTFTCPNGCKDGACLPEQNNPIIKPPFNLKITRTEDMPAETNHNKQNFYLTWNNHNAERFNVYAQHFNMNNQPSSWERAMTSTESKKMLFWNHFSTPVSKVCFYTTGLKNGKESEPSEKVCIDFDEDEEETVKAPFNVKIRKNGSNKWILQWGSSGADKFQVYRSVNNRAYSYIATTKENQLELKDIQYDLLNLNKNLLKKDYVKHCYYVRALKDQKQSRSSQNICMDFKLDESNSNYEDEVITVPVDEEIVVPSQYYFPDTDKNSIEGKASAYLRSKSIIGGFPDGEFKGDRDVNRAELSKFLLLADGVTVGSLQNNGRFPDVKEGEWYVKYVIKAAERGVVDGYPNGLFKPATTVNTAEFLKMLTETFSLQKGMIYHYDDAFDSDWFGKYAGVAHKYNLFPHRDSRYLKPAQLLTRNEVAVAIYKYLTYTEENTGSDLSNVLKVSTPSNFQHGSIRVRENQKNVIVHKLELAASNSAEIQSIKLKVVGNGASENFDKVWIETSEGSVLSNKTALKGDMVEIYFNKSLGITNRPKTIFVKADMASEIAQGDSLRFVLFLPEWIQTKNNVKPVGFFSFGGYDIETL